MMWWLNQSRFGSIYNSFKCISGHVGYLERFGWTSCWSNKTMWLAGWWRGMATYKIPSPWGLLMWVEAEAIDQCHTKVFKTISCLIIDHDMTQRWSDASQNVVWLVDMWPKHTTKKGVLIAGILLNQSLQKPVWSSVYWHHSFLLLPTSCPPRHWTPQRLKSPLNRWVE